MPCFEGFDASSSFQKLYCAFPQVLIEKNTEHFFSTNQFRHNLLVRTIIGGTIYVNAGIAKPDKREYTGKSQPDLGHCHPSGRLVQAPRIRQGHSAYDGAETLWRLIL